MTWLFALLQLVFDFGTSSVHALMPVRKIACGLLQSKGVEVALGWTVGHLFPLELNARALCTRILQLLASVGVNHVDLGEVGLELLNALYSALLNHIIHLIIIVIGRLHMTHVGVSSERLSGARVVISGAHVVLDLLHILSGASDA